MNISAYARVFAACIAILFFCSLRSQSQSTPKELSGDLVIFHAGSLSVPFKEVAAGFMKLHPKVNILMESAGSVASARKITDLNKPCDIMGSADYAVIDNMLVPRYADFNIKFVSNEMAIVYHDKSRMAGQINQKNWYEILLNKEVSFGRADPNADPCGYRTVMTLQLAERFYKKPGLMKQVTSKDQEYIRPKEVDLLAQLESGNIDYIFLYKSVAIQHGLKFLTLPDEINLKSPVYAPKYAEAAVEINGSKPGEKVTMKGEPMIYGVTMLRNAPNKEAALAFLEFLLATDKGMKIMERNGQPSVLPQPVADYTKVPLSLRKYVKK